jgi:hypothetical protein
MSRGRKEEAKQMQISNCRWRGADEQRLPFDQSDVSRARPLLGFLDRELDTLALPKQLEHRSTYRTAVKEVLEAGFITDEAEALVD